VYNAFVDSDQNGRWHIKGNAPKKRFKFVLKFRPFQDIIYAGINNLCSIISFTREEND